MTIQQSHVNHDVGADLVARDVPAPDPAPNDLLVVAHADPVGEILPEEKRWCASEISC